MPEELQSAQETYIERFVALSNEDVLRVMRLHLEHSTYNGMQSNDPIRILDQRPNDPEETYPMYMVVTALVTMNWKPPQGKRDRCRPASVSAVGDVESIPAKGILPRRMRKRIDTAT